MQIPERNTSAAAMDHALQEFLQEGYYLLEFVKDGRLTECLDTTKLSSLTLELAVENPGAVDFVDVYPCEILMPPLPAAGA